MARKSNREKVQGLEAVVSKGNTEAQPPYIPSKGVVEDFDFDALWDLHARLCSREPPQCKRSYHPRDFRAHVIALVTEKQKHIA